MKSALIALLALLVATISYAQQAGIADTTKEKNLQLDDVVITADRLNQRNTVSEIVIRKQTLKSNHGLLEDPLRVVSMMPGVARGGDLFSPSQIYVRGGAPEENLFLNNNAKIYFPYYFGGQKSVFNSDVVENVELLTGGFPAKYGNALSSVLNVTTRDGKRDGYGGLFSFGFYNSSLMAEGPIGKNASFIVAARKTYLDLVMNESAEFPVPNFGDISYKVSLYSGSRHKITLSGLSGYERMDFLAADPEPGLPDRLQTKGNAHTQSLQWQYWHNKLYSKLSLVNTLQGTKSVVGRNLDLNIDGTETGIREDLEYQATERVKLNTGIEAYYNNLLFNSTLPRDPREVDPTDTTVSLSKISFDEQHIVMGAWLSGSMEVTDKLGFSAGLRYDFMDKNKLWSFAPRLSAYYTITPKTEIRLAYTHNYQFPSTEALTANNNIKVPGCYHYIAGVHRRFNKGITGWVEVYHKQYKDLVTYDTSLSYSNKGTGYAQGAELFLSKDIGKFTGWVSYGFAIAKRRSNLDSKEYYFDFDQRHIGNLSLQYKTGRKDKQWYIPFLVNTQVRAESGRPYTPVLAALQTPVGWQQVKGDINSQREAYYLNVNLRVEWRIIANKRLTFTSFFEVWNMLNRRNVLGRTFQYGSQYANNVHIQQYYTTPVLPAGGVRIEFY